MVMVMGKKVSRARRECSLGVEFPAKSSPVWLANFPPNLRQFDWRKWREEIWRTAQNGRPPQSRRVSK